MRNTNVLHQCDVVSEKLKTYEEILGYELYNEIIHLFYIFENIYFGVQDAYSGLHSFSTCDIEEKRVILRATKKTLSRLLESLDDGEKYIFSHKNDIGQILQENRRILKIIETRF